MMDAKTAPFLSRRIEVAALLLGIALGGFFDGIVLHQILQWHHLLSGVQGGAFQDIRVQLLADGIFHLLMYLIAMWGIFLIWRNRRQLERPNGGYQMLGYTFIGFGTWHMIDGVLSHWLLGIHRIRMDAVNPLFWDLLWFSVFGVAFVVIGWLIYRHGGNRSGPSSKTLTGLLVVATLIMAPMAAIPSQQGNVVLVFFRENTSGTQIFRAADAAQARIVSSSVGGRVWAMEVPNQAGKIRLVQNGASWVASSPILIGCLAWTTSSSS